MVEEIIVIIFLLLILLILILTNGKSILFDNVALNDEYSNKINEANSKNQKQKQKQKHVTFGKNQIKTFVKNSIMGTV